MFTVLYIEIMIYFTAWEALLVGTIGALLVCMSMPVFDMVGIDKKI